MRSGIQIALANNLVGDRDKGKALQSLYLTISDQDPVEAIDRMMFDGEEPENGGVFSK